MTGSKSTLSKNYFFLPSSAVIYSETRLITTELKGQGLYLN